MKLMISLLLSLFSLFNPAYAEVEQVTYNVTDMLDKQYSRTETWTMQAFMEGGKKIFRLTKDTTAKDRSREVEITQRWFVETRFAGRVTYLKEVLSEHPRDMEAGESSYGYVEERLVSDNTIVRAWPFFCKIEEAVGGLRAIFTHYLPEGMRLEVVRDYEEAETYYFPLRESRVLKSENGVHAHTIFARKK